MGVDRFYIWVLECSKKSYYLLSKVSKKGTKAYYEKMTFIKLLHYQNKRGLLGLYFNLLIFLYSKYKDL